MVLLGACITFLVIGIVLGWAALWAVKLRPMDRRLADAEAKEKELDATVQALQSKGAELAGTVQVLQELAWSVVDRVGHVESIMRPESGEASPRLAILERKQSIDTETLVAHMKVFRRELNMFDERLIYMASHPAFDAPNQRPANGFKGRDSVTAVIQQSNSK